MIYAVVAQTGGGKSYLCARKVIDFLRTHPTGHVVTNLALLIDEICDYFTREDGEMFDAMSRIRLLNLDEVGEFWLHYGVGFDLPGTRMELKDGTGKIRRELDYSCRDPQKGGSSHPVLYVIDEADEIFDAKSFAGMAHDLRFYTRHQRKFCDNVYFIAPCWEFLVKELRVMCHGVWEMENGAQMKLGKFPVIGGLFKGLPWIKGTLWRVRQGGAWGGANETPRDTTRFMIDAKGIGRCYRTEVGLGVAGNAASVQKAEKVKGLSPGWMVGVAVALIALLFAVPKLFGSVFNKSVLSVSHSVNPPGTPAKTNLVPVVEEHKKPVAVVAAQPVPLVAAARPKVFLSGYAGFGRSMQVYLSDGRQTDRFLVIDSRTVEVEGERYTFAPRSSE